MRILVVGGGGREHALCWKLAQSPKTTALFCAPGNAGTSNVATNINLKAEDTAGLVAYARDNQIDLVVVGPEVPLVAGLADDLKSQGIACFGCSAEAAKLEGSKAFSKIVMDEAGIPTAAYAEFDDAETAKAYVREQGAPIVIKADGLAAGKGVVVAMTLDDALGAVDELQAYGSRMIIEEFMTGPELSYFALSDGTTAVGLTSAQDHKRVGDGDIGPNTGGMGAFSPTAYSTDETHNQILQTVVQPTIDLMAKRGTPFVGVLFVGLMMTETGPKVVEFNVRFGDPECQVLMQRMKSDLAPLLMAAATENLKGQTVEWHEETALTVVLASKGYPGSYEKGTAINSLPMDNEALTVFHAGTTDEEGMLQAAGGRVLNITARGKTAREARDKAYDAIQDVNWPNGFWRNDIAWQAL
ncbi:MAG: phosphoribosylamine--glycine ligase [Alphaproteobacteria bacterium]